MTSQKRAAILQSNYIPWKGYFDLINQVDVFILYDDANYTKNDWRNRNKIMTSQGPQWLTVPVIHESLTQKIKETKTANSSWRRKHWNSISQNYARAPFFKSYRDQFEMLFLDSDEVLLSRINYDFIRTINGILGITTRITWSEEYTITEIDKTAKLVEILKAENAVSYLSGPAAKDYINVNLFDNSNISIEWMNYLNYPEYKQVFEPFQHAVSVIDLIFNEGPNAKNFMKSFKTI